MSQEKEFHIVLWGATSFVGKIIAEYLLKRHGVDGNCRWALAARNRGKLEALKAELGPEASDIPILVGDATDVEFLNTMVGQADVVLTTVGPYLAYGEALVEACVKAGTDYCDLTGEIIFVRSMMDKYQSRAEQSGAKILNCCGFDSVPSDAGVHYLNRFVEAEYGEPLSTVEMQVVKAKGGVSGGTIASAIETLKFLQKEPAWAKVVNNPYSICPEGHRKGIKQPSLHGPKRSRFTERWLNHFVMAPVNSRVVHATNALTEFRYSEEFQYTEWQVAPSYLKAAATEAALRVGMLLLYFPISRRLLQRFVLPKPGEGPSKEQQRTGFFHLEFYGQTQNGKQVMARVTGDADPGYGSTAKQIAEVATCLSKLSGQKKPGGFYTPLAALGDDLIVHLTEFAGLTFEAWSLD